MTFETKPGTFCPLLKKDCIGFKCAWIVNVKGKKPQSEEVIDQWGCSMQWLPMLLINTAQEVRQGAAATESLRNETAEAAKTNLVMLANLVTRGQETPMRLVHKDPD